MWGKSRQNRRLPDKAIFRFLGASAKVFVFGALRHQLLYEFGDAAMEFLELATLFDQFLGRRLEFDVLGSSAIHDARRGAGGYRRRAMMKPSRKAIARDWIGDSRVKFAKRSRGPPGWRPASMASAIRWLVVSTASVAVRTASVASPSLVDALAPDVSPSPVI
jgi:hypothetical protein